MNDFRPWIRPTVLGPFLTTFSFVAIAHLTFGEEVLLAGHRLDSLLLGLLTMGFFSSALVVMLIMADVTFLQRKWRKLPTGGSAWLSSMLAPVFTFGLWSRLGWGDGESVPETVARIVIPMAVSCYGLRLFFGKKP
ncbi:MAG: hypothetical protein J0L92_23540 [Deltaproteobacteria bacterium]|nr:hypothetical protein [Deltaproteobacteria bacterium]